MLYSANKATRQSIMRWLELVLQFSKGFGYFLCIYGTNDRYDIYVLTTQMTDTTLMYLCPQRPNGTNARFVT